MKLRRHTIQSSTLCFNCLMMVDLQMDKVAQLASQTQSLSWHPTLEQSTCLLHCLGTQRWNLQKKTLCKKYVRSFSGLCVHLFHTSIMKMTVVFWHVFLWMLLQVRRHFRPELLNRLDEIVVFDPLSHDQLKKVARIQMKYVAVRLAERGVALAVTDAALDLVLLVAYDPVSKTVTLFDWFVIKNLSCQGMCLRP